jgi:hypothetical protein
MAFYHHPYHQLRAQVSMVVHTVVQAAPCDNCRHATDCGTDRACEALRVFVETGRCTCAARQPSREIAQAIDSAAPRAFTAAERWRNYERLKVKMLRDRPLR